MLLPRWFYDYSSYKNQYIFHSKEHFITTAKLTKNKELTFLGANIVCLIFSTTSGPAAAQAWLNASALSGATWILSSCCFRAAGLILWCTAYKQKTQETLALAAYTQQKQGEQQHSLHATLRITSQISLSYILGC